MLKRLYLPLFILLYSAQAFAVTRTSVANGLWSATATWSGGVVPVAGDDVVVDGESVVLDAATVCANGSAACGQTLVISGGASVMAGRGTTTLWINCATATNPCISISGTLIGNAGQTLKVGSDSGTTGVNPDRIVVNSGGTLSWRGRKLHAGAITAVTIDEATVTDPYLAFGLPTRDFEFEDANAHFPITSPTTQQWSNADDCVDNCYVVRFTSGDRAWRWYNTKAASANRTTRVLVDFDSRSNPAQSNSGQGLAVQATAKSDGYGQAYVTGTATVANGSTAVTGSGTTWTHEMAEGSRFYCTNVDTAANARRIVRVASATSLVLDTGYGTANCAAGAAYAIVDDNQPFPFFDHSEHIKIGDTYEIIQPATIQGAVITTGAEPTGSSGLSFSNIQCSAGSRCLFGYTSIKWMGAVQGSVDNRDGAVWLDTPSYDFTDSEIKGYATGEALLITTASNMIVARNFIHRVVPTLTALGDGHGIIWDVNAGILPPAIGVNNQEFSNRIELTGDDTTWVRAPQRGFRNSRNIFKYIGAHLLSDSSNCTEFGGYAGANGNPSGSAYFDDCTVTENICMNNGGITGSNNDEGFAASAGFVWRTQGATGGTGYRDRIGYARNLVVNMQTGPGFARAEAANAADTLAEYLNNNVTVSGNYVSNTAYGGVSGAQNVYNNVVISWGLDRNTTATIAAYTFISHNLKGNVSIPIDEAIATTRWASADTIRQGILQHAGYISGNSVNLGYSPTPTISDNVIFSHHEAIVVGSYGGAGQLIKGSPVMTVTRNLLSCDLSRVTSGFDVFGIDQWLDTPNPAQVYTFNVISGCYQGNILIRGFATPPAPVENNNYLINSAVAASGLTPNGTDSLSSNLGWSPLSFSFDRRSALVTTVGPRSVGLDISSAWHATNWPVLAGINIGDSIDADKDGVSDLFDNCPRELNPTQLDSNNNGVGDACGG